MNRRGFLSRLAAIAAGAALDPERLLWKPKLISIPLATVADQWPTPRRPRVRIGDTLWVRKPPKFVVTDSEVWILS